MKSIKHLYLFAALLTMMSSKVVAQYEEVAEAVFGMGCFWCGEAEFRHHATNQLLPGIVKVRVGYAGGVKPQPTYPDHEGYVEAVKVSYNPSLISYDKLLSLFWHNIDPFDRKGQFCDKGSSYVAVIYYLNALQKAKAEESKITLENQLGKPFVTQIIPFTTFYEAEEYHQNYEAKNPTKYRFYRWNCGRDARLKAIWK